MEMIKMYRFDYGSIINNQEEILLKIKNNFLDEDFIDEDYPNKVLMINHLKNKKIIYNKVLQDIKISKRRKVYFYHERKKELYLVEYKYVCKYIEQLEPWEEVDCLIFNNTFKWIIGYNHEEEIYYSKPYK